MRQRVTKRIEGKAAIYDYIKDYPDQIHLSSFTAPTVYRSADTNTIIAEFQCDGHVIETGRLIAKAISVSSKRGRPHCAL